MLERASRPEGQRGWRVVRIRRSRSNVESFLKSRRTVPEVPSHRSHYTVGVPEIPQDLWIRVRVWPSDRRFVAISRAFRGLDRSKSFLKYRDSVANAHRARARAFTVFQEQERSSAPAACSPALPWLRYWRPCGSSPGVSSWKLSGYLTDIITETARFLGVFPSQGGAEGTRSLVESQRAGAPPLFLKYRVAPCPGSSRYGTRHVRSGTRLR